MNLAVSLAIARRDLLALSRNAGAVAPMVIIPVVFLAVFPTALYAVSRFDRDLGELGMILDLLPAGAVDDTTSSGARLAVALATYVVPVLLQLVPLVVVSVVAIDSVAGERERGTLEGLMLAPVSDTELLVGKLLGALIPGLAVGLLVSGLYVVVVDAALWSVAGGPILPSASWAVLVLWFGPAFTTAALGLTVLVSARSRSVQAASQVSGLAIFPLVGLVIGQLTGIMLLAWYVTAVLGAVLWLVAVVLVRAGASQLRPERQVRVLT